MTILAVVGDCTTTTCVALAAQWPVDDDVIVLEADPSGGSLSGWLDTPASPSLATLVATAASEAASDTHRTIHSMVQRSESGVRFIAAPIRTVPAHRAIAEAATSVLPALAGGDVVVLADCGRHHAAVHRPVALAVASAIVVVHRQTPASAGAAGVRLERLVELVGHVATDNPVILGVIGTEPFDVDELVGYVADAHPGAVTAAVRIAEDPLSAAVLAGRSGVSARRLARLPLLRSAADAAATLRRIVEPAPLVDGASVP